METAACCFAHSLIMVTLARVSGQWIRMRALSDLCMLVTYPATHSNSTLSERQGRYPATYSNSTLSERQRRYPATHSNSTLSERQGRYPATRSNTATVHCQKGKDGTLQHAATQQQYTVRKVRTVTCNKVDTKCNSALQHSDGIVKRTSTLVIIQIYNRWFRGRPSLCTSFGSYLSACTLNKRACCLQADI